MGPRKCLRIGTRSSPLARWQAEFVAGRLRAVAGGAVVELVEIQTAGDRVRDVPLSQVGGDGVFTKEIQKALLAGRVDAAVHSLKDLPTAPVPGLVLAAVPARGPAGDVLASRNHASFAAVPPGAVLGTGSLRRRAQILNRRPDLRVVEVRGNVETRLRKLAEQPWAGLVLAEAGLRRLGLDAVITEVLDPDWFLPAPGQGALAVECRADDHRVVEWLKWLDEVATHRAVRAERAFLAGLGGGCAVPIGARAEVRGDRLHLAGAVLSPGGEQRLDGRVEGPPKGAEEIGRRLADALLARGAAALLER